MEATDSKIRRRPAARVALLAALAAAACPGCADGQGPRSDADGEAGETPAEWLLEIIDGPDAAEEGDGEPGDPSVDEAIADDGGEEDPPDPCLAVPGRRGIIEEGDPLWTGAAPLPLAYDFDADGCVDGTLRMSEGRIERIGLDGAVAWSAVPATAEGVNAGIAAVEDWSADGVLDVVAVATEPAGGTCGADPMLRTHLLFVDGADGSIESPASPLDDLCWTFPTATYPTRQYYTGSVVVADFAPSHEGNEVILFPYYATMGWVLNRAGAGAWIMLQAETDPSFRHLFYPSTESFDTEYNATNAAPCQPSPWGGGACYVQYAHCANPVTTSSGNLFLLTSGRAVSYRPDLSPTGDHVWAAGGRTDHAGRNYGLVTRFAMNGGEYVTLHGGCSSANMQEAMRAGELTTAGNPLCGIHRHYEIFSIVSGVVGTHASRFYAYAPEPGIHEGRLQYPRNAVFRNEPSGTVWSAWSLYEGGRWNAVVADPLSPDAPAVTLASCFLWDVRDLDGDGAPELLVTFLPTGAAAGSVESLIPPWSVEILAFDGEEIVSQGGVEGWVPAMVAQPNRASLRSSDGALFPAAVTDVENDGVLEPVVTDVAGAFVLLRRGPGGWAIDG
jgi:hypothetical protein